MAAKNGYTSDIMEFVTKFRRQKPEDVSRASKLRKTWWDKSETDVSVATELKTTNEKPTAYAYFDYGQK